jgi:ADP-dependent NAD(P)H-hydrate dehydratase
MNDALLRRWSLPIPGTDGDKEDRGRVLVVGGPHQMPDAVILAAIAALRAGLGKLTIATAARVAPMVAQAV